MEPVLASTHGPDGHAVRRGDPDQRLHLFGRSRRHRCEGPVSVRVDGEVIAVGVTILLGGEGRVAADHHERLGTLALANMALPQ